MENPAGPASPDKSLMAWINYSIVNISTRVTESLAWEAAKNRCVCGHAQIILQQGSFVVQKIFGSILVGAAVAISPVAANAAITLNIVDSFDRSSAFGLAFDGTNIWWSDSGGSIHEMTTSGVDTGNVITGTTWSALAWNGMTNQVTIVENNGITGYDRAVGVQLASSLNPQHTNIAGSPNFLTDGLDIEGNTLWWSPDVSFVAHSPLDGSGSVTAFLPAVGGYSGVEYLTVGSDNYVFVVNDATNPRQLCFHALDSTQLGCATLPNSRYEDLAFDGRYLWAADFYGNRIDKIDVLSDGGSVFDPSVPEPSTWAMALFGFGAIGMAVRRGHKRTTSVRFA